jgi:hypothetical protein
MGDEALEVYTVTGEGFDRLFGFAFHPSADLAAWHAPLAFMVSTIRLCHPNPEPSALFAALQAYILDNVRHTPDLPSAHALIDSVLDAMSHMRGGRAFLFCQVIDRDARAMTFLATPSRRAARTYLWESGLLQTDRAALLLAVSFVCLAGSAVLSSAGVAEPLIGEDGCASARFALLLTTGSLADVATQEFQAIGSAVLPGVPLKQAIGFVVDGEVGNGSVSDTLIRPDDRMWVRDLGCGFDLLAEVDGVLRRFDPCDIGAEEWTPIAPHEEIYARLID